MKTFHKLDIVKKVLKPSCCLLLFVFLHQPLLAKIRQPNEGCGCQTCSKEERQDVQRDEGSPSPVAKMGDDRQNVCDQHDDNGYVHVSKGVYWVTFTILILNSYVLILCLCNKKRI